MAQLIKVALNVRDRDLTHQLSNLLGELGAVQIVGVSTNGAVPAQAADVVAIEDPGDKEDLLEKIGRVRAGLPQAAVFVISAWQDPEHIVEVMKAGVAEYFLLPVNRQKLQAAIDKVRGAVTRTAPAAKGAVYSFVSSKGGLGATVLAVNTAAALALHGEGSVALLDNSLSSGDSSVLLDLMPERTIADVCQHFHRLDSAFLRNAMAAHGTGLRFLAAPTAPEQSENIHAEHLSRILDLAKGLHDHTVVDCKSMSVDQCAVEAFKASDRIFIVTDLSMPAVRNAARLTELIRKLRINPQKVEVVVNRFIKGGIPPVDQVEKNLGRRVFWLFPNSFGEVVNSINQGVPLVQGRSGNPFAKSVTEFTQRLLHPTNPQPYRGMRGFMGRSL